MLTIPTFAVIAAIAAATPAAAMASCETPVPLAKVPDAGVPLVPGQEIDAEVTKPSPLAELASDSPWRARFEAAADTVLAALRSRDINRWQPLLGGRWLGENDRRAVAALLDDQCSVFAPLIHPDHPVARQIFGWTIPATYSAADRAEIAARPEAEALVCWSAKDRDEIRWPRTAAEADNAPRRDYGCARITYSMRGKTPSWRAFVETVPRADP